MRVVFTLLALIAVLVWLGLELRQRNRAVAQALLGFALLFSVVLVAAFFELF